MNRGKYVYNKIKSWNWKKIAVRGSFVVLGATALGAGVFYKLFQEINKFSTHIQKFETHMTGPISTEDNTANLVEYSYNSISDFFNMINEMEDLNEKLYTVLGHFQKDDLKLLNPNFITIVSNELYLLPKIT